MWLETGAISRAPSRVALRKGKPVERCAAEGSPGWGDETNVQKPTDMCCVVRVFVVEDRA